MLDPKRIEVTLHQIAAGLKNASDGYLNLASCITHVAPYQLPQIIAQVPPPPMNVPIPIRKALLVNCESKTGSYLIPGEDKLTDTGHLCMLDQALYPVERINWCIYALFINDYVRIRRYCLLKTLARTTNLAYSLDGFLWAISALTADKLQIRCVMETHIITIILPYKLWMWVMYVRLSLPIYTSQLSQS